MAVIRGSWIISVDVTDTGIRAVISNVHTEAEKTEECLFQNYPRPARYPELEPTNQYDEDACAGELLIWVRDTFDRV